LIAILVIAGIISLFIAFQAGRRTSKSGVTTASSTNDPNISSCRDACNQWDRRRSERCLIQGDEAAARSRGDALRSELGIVLATVAGLLAAGVAAAVIPVIGWGVAAGFFTAAGIAAATAAFISGRLVAADAEMARLQQAAHDARQREAEARETVLRQCSSDEANACLNRSPPC
jgi:Flp pilus assembly protein TadB